MAKKSGDAVAIEFLRAVGKSISTTVVGMQAHVGMNATALQAHVTSRVVGRWELSKKDLRRLSEAVRESCSF